ncbi:MAG TPA: hypothetical protein PKA90_16815 [Ignavibacteria bacterium]|nr:hypothetical protein [Ignavibacteria bacterium]HMR42080.1 hypothetical protein [Ignavibacteria bacterium]
MLQELNKLSEMELARFESYVRSPYFNTYKTLIKLFIYLKSRYPEITKDDISVRKLSNVIYGERKINQDKVRKLISEFTRLLENFLVQTEFESHTVRNRILLLKQLRIKNISKRLKINFKKLFIELSEKYTEGFEYYDNTLNLGYEMLNYRVDRQDDALKNKLKFTDSVDMLFIFLKLRNFIQMTNIYYPDARENKLIKEDIFFESIFKFFEKNKNRIYRDHPEIVLVYFSYLMTMTFDDRYLHKLVSYYRSNKNEFKGRLQFTYSILIEGYLRVKFSSSEKPVEKKDRILLNGIHDNLFFKTNDFYKYVIKDEEAVIPKMIFDTIVDNGLALRKFDWVNAFIKENIKHVSHEIRESLNNISLAKCSFHSGDFDNALKHLLMVRDVEPGGHLATSMLMARVQYERGEYKISDLALDALRKYITDEKFNYPVIRKKTMKFIKYLKKLIRLKQKPDDDQQFRVRQIIDQINIEPKPIYSYQWLLEKMEEMEEMDEMCG